MQAVLFLCVANSARSQLAEGLARAALPPETRIWSAGSNPTTLNPLAVHVLAEIGIDISKHVSKSVEAVPLEEVECVVTLCAEEVCPTFAGKVDRYHWPIADPAAVQGDDAARLDAFRSARDEIRGRIRQQFGADVPELPPIGQTPPDPRKLLAAVWRTASDDDAPTLHQLSPARVVRVDVDPQSGYLAVTTKDETFRAMGVRLEFISKLVSEFTGRPLEDVEKALSAGPARIDSVRAS